jgi:hypothetical protein
MGIKSGRGYTTKKAKRGAANAKRRKEKAKAIRIARQKTKELHNKQLDFVMSRNKRAIDTKVADHNKAILEQHPDLVRQLLDAQRQGDNDAVNELARKAGLITTENYHTISANANGMRINAPVKDNLLTWVDHEWPNANNHLGNMHDLVELGQRESSGDLIVKQIAADMGIPTPNEVIPFEPTMRLIIGGEQQLLVGDVETSAPNEAGNSD